MRIQVYANDDLIHMDNTIVELKHIYKRFGTNEVLTDVSLSFETSTVHALVGENGAGKSTLTKILCGVIPQSKGVILFNDKRAKLKNVAAAHDLGIRMVYQELYLMKDLTVAQNIYIGREIKKGPFIDDGAMNLKCQELFDEYGIDLLPDAFVKDLSVAQMQMVEILKNISQELSVLVLDEPTTALSSKEVDDLFVMLQKLKDKGVCIIYISHKMDEVLKISDKISVLRDGILVGTVNKEDTSREEIIKMMIGRDVTWQVKEKSEVASGSPVVLNVKEIQTNKLKDISFDLRKGEILGFSGLMGSGRTEVARAIFGADKAETLDLEINGEPVSIRSTEEAIKHGICYLSEDRKQFGLMLGHSIYNNETISSLDLKTNFFLIDDNKLQEEADKFQEELKIKYHSIDDQIDSLSGGNQQKCIIARWLLKDAEIFIFDEPTKGIDIGAKSEIYVKIKELAKKGKSIIVISSELEEITQLCDRVAVMCEGRITKILDISEVSQETIMEYAVRRNKQ